MNSDKVKRIAHLMTIDENSDRCIFSFGILNLVGFDVKIHKAVPDLNPVLSHSKTSRLIFEEILNSDEEWHYIFEDDINIIKLIKLEEIVEYEKISHGFFFLGVCKYGNDAGFITPYEVNNHKVYSVSGCVRGAHAVAFSKTELKNFMTLFNFFTSGKNPILYLDVIYELYTLNNPSNVIRMDLESNIHGHRGIFFQDRDQFKSTMP